MRLTVASILLLSLVVFLSTPVHADEYSIYGNSGIPGLFVVSTNIDGSLNLGTTGASQDFLTTFDYDSLTQGISNFSFTDTGTLSSNLKFAGVAVTSLDWLFSWSNADEVIRLDVPANNLPTVAGQNFVSGQEYGTKNVLVQCLDQQCTNDYPSTFPTGLVGPFNNAVLGVTLLGPSPTPAPEPSTSILMVSSLAMAGIVFALRRRRRRPIWASDSL